MVYGSHPLAPGSAYGSLMAMAREAGAFIQDPFGFCEWREDHVLTDEIGNGGTSVTETPQRTGRAGGGRLHISAASGQGYSWQNFRQPYPIVSNARTDAWYCAWQGVITAIPATGQIMPIGLTAIASAGANPVLQIGSDTNPPHYIGLVAYGPSSTAFWCMKIWDGAAQRVLVTTVPLDVGVYHRVALASDGMGTRYILQDGVIGWSDTDDRGIFEVPGAPQIFVRNPGASSAAEVIFDLHYAAGQRL